MAAAPATKFVLPSDLSTDLVQDPASKQFKVAPAAVQNAQVKYTFGLDATTKKLTLTGSDGSSSAVDPHLFEADLGNASISNGVLTFKDQNGNVTGTLDTTVFLQAVNLAVGPGLAPLAAGANGTLGHGFTLSLLADPVAGNVLRVSATGVSVVPADIVAIVNGMVFSAVVSAAVGGLTITFGSRSITVPGVVAQDAQGNNLGIMLTYQP